MMPRSTTLYTRLWVFALGLTLALATTGCGKKRGQLTKKESEEGLGLPSSHSTTGQVRLEVDCPVGAQVIDPDDDTPEEVVYELLSAALSADDEASFKRFYAPFRGEKDEGWVRKQYWPRAREHVAKYVGDDDDADAISYTVCDRAALSDGRVKIFVLSHDEDKSNPPITMKKNGEGVWKVVAYTP
jgi:hypothetical protein